MPGKIHVRAKINGEDLDFLCEAVRASWRCSGMSSI